MIQDINNMVERYGHDFYKKTFTIGSDKWSGVSRTQAGSVLMRGIIEHLDYEKAELLPEGIRNPDNLVLTFKQAGSLFNNDIILWESKDYMLVGKKEVHFLGSVIGYKGFLVRDYDLGD